MDQRENTSEQPLADLPTAVVPTAELDAFFPDPSSAGDASSAPGSALCSETTLRHCDTQLHEGLRHPVLGRYVLLEKLGEGGMGAVFRARHLHLETDVAVKVLLPGIEARHAEVVDRFFREARIAAGLRCDNLVRVLDVARDDASGAHYLVMEFVRGATAAQWLGRQTKIGRKPTEKDTLDLVAAATRGLAAAHAADIVHRDVKPANVLLPRGDDGQLVPSRAQLTDLGLARAVQGSHTLTDGRLALGSPGYMAPEQTRDTHSVGKPADVFAMGATLYALLSGRAPFRGSTAFEVLSATVRGEYEKLSDVRPDVSYATCEVVHRCLADRAEDRYPDAQSLLEALETCRARRTRPASPPMPVDYGELPTLRAPPTPSPVAPPSLPALPAALPAAIADEPPSATFGGSSVGAAPSSPSLASDSREEIWTKAPERPRGAAPPPLNVPQTSGRRRRGNPLPMLLGAALVCAAAGVYVLPRFGIHVEDLVRERVAVASPPAVVPSPAVHVEVAPPAAGKPTAWIVGATGGFQFADETLARAPTGRRGLHPGGWVFTEGSEVSMELASDARLTLAPNTLLRGAAEGTPPTLERGAAELRSGEARVVIGRGAVLRVGEIGVRSAGDGAARVRVRRTSGARAGVTLTAEHGDAELSAGAHVARVPAGAALTLMPGPKKLAGVGLQTAVANTATVTVRMERDGGSVELELPAGAHCIVHRKRGKRGSLVVSHLAASTSGQPLRGRTRLAPDDPGRAFSVARGAQERLP